MTHPEEIYKRLPDLNPALKEKMLETGMVKRFEKGETILRKGQYLKVIPVLLEGLIKVYTYYKDKEFFLYYIRPKESCVLSFVSALANAPGNVVAVASQPCECLLLPVNAVRQWVKDYPEFNLMFYRQFLQRYEELLELIHLLLFENLDSRLYDYLHERARIDDSQVVKISHRQLAQDLGTAREVVSRILKKLEKEGKVKLIKEGIKIEEV